MHNRPIRPAKGKLPMTDPIVHERLRWKSDRAEMQSALDAAHDEIERQRAALDECRLVAAQLAEALDWIELTDDGQDWHEDHQRNGESFAEDCLVCIQAAALAAYRRLGGSG